jgi:hypothetical protein
MASRATGRRLGVLLKRSLALARLALDSYTIADSSRCLLVALDPLDLFYLCSNENGSLVSCLEQYSTMNESIDPLVKTLMLVLS